MNSDKTDPTSMQLMLREVLLLHQHILNHDVTSAVALLSAHAPVSHAQRIAQIRMAGHARGHGARAKQSNTYHFHDSFHMHSSIHF